MRGRYVLGLLALLVGTSPTAHAEPAPAPEPAPDSSQSEAADPKADDFEWIVLPNIESSTDRGLGGGLLGIFYWYGEGARPYLHRIELAAVVTSKLFQNHYAIWERLGLRGGRLRFRVKIGFNAIQDHNFCGIGNAVTCDPDDARAGAADIGLEPTDDGYDEFVDNYYFVRFMRPYLETRLRYQLRPDRRDLQLAVNASSGLFLTGFIGDDGPYPGSLYDQTFPGGEDELTSVLEAGVVLDRRDNEIQPTDGQLVGAYARGGLALSDEPRVFAGTSLNYARFDSLGDTKLVLANRATLDLQFGDVPLRELGRVSGFWNTDAFGGGFGRGVRLSRFIGKVKLVSQSELRWTSPRVFRRAQILVYGFLDTGWLAASARTSGGDLSRVLVSGGAGPGLSWGRSFVARLDVGVSRYEDFGPFFYLRIGHPF